jgi:hypothetical protein
VKSKNIFFGVQRKVARAWHEITQAASIHWLLRDEFFELRPQISEQAARVRLQMIPFPESCFKTQQCNLFYWDNTTNSQAI